MESWLGFTPVYVVETAVVVGGAYFFMPKNPHSEDPVLTVCSRCKHSCMTPAWFAVSLPHDHLSVPFHHCLIPAVLLLHSCLFHGCVLYTGMPSGFWVSSLLPTCECQAHAL